MGVQDKLIQGLNKSFDLVGTKFRLRYFDITPGSVWDDDVTLVQAGADLWTSGVVMPLRLREGSNDSLLVQQGKLVNSDQRLYVNGSLLFNGSTQSVDIQIGSPTGDLYTTIEAGGITWTAEASPVYKVQFIRRLTGSLT